MCLNSNENEILKQKVTLKRLLSMLPIAQKLYAGMYKYLC